MIPLTFLRALLVLWLTPALLPAQPPAADTVGRTAGVAPAVRPVRGVPARSRAVPTLRVAKWALLGVAAGFGGYAILQSRRANDAYDALRALCREAPGRCALGTGRYGDAEAEALYGLSGRRDRLARLGVVGSQVALLGGATLFILDLRNARSPEDIPYTPPADAAPARSARAVLAAGLSLPF